MEKEYQAPQAELVQFVSEQEIADNGTFDLGSGAQPGGTGGGSLPWQSGYKSSDGAY